MSCSHFAIRRICFLTLLVASACYAVDNRTSKQKYNIIFLMCDSMDGRVLDPTSPISSYLDMPFMWSLAAQGVNFIRTYSNNPQCAPSRTSMFTGRHTHQIKAWANEKPIVATPGSGLNSGAWELDEACINEYDRALCEHWASQQNVSDTFVDTLQSVGVDVMLFGKVDVGGNVIHRADQQPYKPWGNGFHGRDLATVGRAADIRKSTKRQPRAKKDVPSKSIRRQDWNTISDCMKWLEDHPDAPGQWLLYCSILIPHPPYECNPSTLSQTSSNVSLPNWFAEAKDFPESSMHPYDSYMSFSKEMMDEQGRFTKDMLIDNMRCWYAMCAQTDLMLGQVWAKAGETRNLDKTIVIFTSDHGEMHMDHRQHLKNSMYEGSSRVPLLVALPGSKPERGSRSAFEDGRRVSDLTSLLDIYPTFVDGFGAPSPPGLGGNSVLPYLTGSLQPRTDRHVVSMYMSNMANTNAFMIRQGPWKYIAYGQYGPSWYKKYDPQLFNVEEDPSEGTNLWSKSSSIAKHLDSLLRSVVNYEAVDREVKMEEKMLYDRYYKHMSQHALQRRWEIAYKGFDAADMEKVQQWYEATESLPQPQTPLQTMLV
eukprot:TRINITY_DN28727_c0_g3_i1.p1 TRINITY_DN28727_c0_g3~~TRINITY_DN28727_c0_g3_i1.p1  ORF type:complete len:595 (+),score=47.68 TRINITY_DN28727_c0_g3_i1:59-1843(+)